MRSKSRWAAAIVALAGLMGSLGACGVNEAGAAAVVNDRVVSERDAQVAAAEANKGLEGLQAPFSAATALPWLILSPFVLAEAAREGRGVSEYQARSALTKLADPSPATVELVRVILAAQNTLSDAGIQRVLAEVGRAKVSVNPRYGSFDPKQPGRLTPVIPSWVRTVPPSSPATPEPAATATP
ncbi:MAG TPA: hypothetical protein VFJ97_05615 [Dermatophilaceae bacterium]|nr:hypothetical protein [Dermatophilaceae bacterium]